MKTLLSICALVILFLLSLTLANLYAASSDCTDDYCNGRNFAEVNELKSAEECKYANRPHFDSDMSDEFMRGCGGYF